MPTEHVNDIFIHYQTSGHGDALVLLHGLGSSSSDWAEQVQYFSQKYQVIAIDCRGHGKSDKPDSPYSIPLFASDVLGLLDTLQIQKFHLVGFSMGGMTAFQLGINQPQRLLSLTIINSAPSVPYKTLWEKITVWQRLLCIRLLGMEKLGKLIGLKLFPLPEQKHHYQEFVSNMQANSQTAYIHSLKAFLGWSVDEQLHRLSYPVLVIGGDQDYTTVASKEEYCKKIPSAKLVIIQNSRHATPIDQAHKFNETLDNFLDNLPQRHKSTTDRALTN